MGMFDEFLPKQTSDKTNKPPVIPAKEERTGTGMFDEFLQAKPQAPQLANTASGYLDLPKGVVRGLISLPDAVASTAQTALGGYAKIADLVAGNENAGQGGAIENTVNSGVGIARDATTRPLADLAEEAMPYSQGTQDAQTKLGTDLEAITNDSNLSTGQKAGKAFGATIENPRGTVPSLIESIPQFVAGSALLKGAKVAEGLAGVGKAEELTAKAANATSRAAQEAAKAEARIASANIAAANGERLAADGLPKLATKASKEADNLIDSATKAKAFGATKAVEAEALAAKAAKADKFQNAAIMGLGNATLEGAGASNSARDEFLGLAKNSPDQLMKNPQFAQLANEKGFDEAVRITAEMAGNTAFAPAAALGAGASLVTGGGLEGALFNRLAGKAGTNAIASGVVPTLKAVAGGVVKGAAGEGIEETMQGASGQYAQNVSMQPYTDVDPMKGVVEQAASGGAMGLLSGGVGGGAGRAYDKATRPSLETEQANQLIIDNANTAKAATQAKAFSDAKARGDILQAALAAGAMAQPASVTPTINPASTANASNAGGGSGGNAGGAGGNNNATPQPTQQSSQYGVAQGAQPNNVNLDTAPTLQPIGGNALNGQTAKNAQLSSPAIEGELVDNKEVSNPVNRKLLGSDAINGEVVRGRIGNQKLLPAPKPEDVQQAAVTLAEIDKAIEEKTLNPKHADDLLRIAQTVGVDVANIPTEPTKASTVTQDEPTKVSKVRAGQNTNTGAQQQAEVPSVQASNATVSTQTAAVKPSGKTPKGNKDAFVKAWVNTENRKAGKKTRTATEISKDTAGFTRQAQDEYDNRIVTALNNGEKLSAKTEVPDHGLTLEEFSAPLQPSDNSREAHNEAIAKAQSRGLVIRNQTPLTNDTKTNTSTAKAQQATQGADSNSPAADSTGAQEAKAGVVGGEMASGQVALTSTGRKTTPYPKFNLYEHKDNPDRTQIFGRDVTKTNNWLIENAILEAESRGDDLTQRIFQTDYDRYNDKKNKNRKYGYAAATKDHAEEYLFGEVIPQRKSFLKPFSQPTQEAPNGKSTNPTPKETDTQAVNSRSGKFPLPGQSTTTVGNNGKETSTKTEVLNEAGGAKAEPATQFNPTHTVNDDGDIVAVAQNENGVWESQDKTEYQGYDAEPIESKVATKPLSEMEELKAQMGQAIGEAVSLLGGKMNMTEEEETKLVPIMAKIFRIAAKMGFVKFKETASYVMGQIRELADKETADKFTLEHLLGGYASAGGKDFIGMSEIKSLEDLLSQPATDKAEPAKQGKAQFNENLSAETDEQKYRSLLAEGMTDGLITAIKRNLSESIRSHKKYTNTGVDNRYIGQLEKEAEDRIEQAKTDNRWNDEFYNKRISALINKDIPEMLSFFVNSSDFNEGSQLGFAKIAGLGRSYLRLPMNEKRQKVYDFAGLTEQERAEQEQRLVDGKAKAKEISEAESKARNEQWIDESAENGNKINGVSGKKFIDDAIAAGFNQVFNKSKTNIPHYLLLNPVTRESYDFSAKKSVINHLREYAELAIKRLQEADQQPATPRNAQAKKQTLHSLISSGNVNAVLEHIIANSAIPLHQILANKLIGQLPDGINIVIADTLKNKRGTEGVMNYDYGTRAISVNLAVTPKLKESAVEKGFIHELIHAVTGEKINAIMGNTNESTLTRDEKIARTQLKLIANLITKHVEKNGITGDLKKVSGLATENLRELITYGLTDPVFQKMLADIKMGKDKTAWTQFVHAIAKLLGIELNTEQETALSALLMIGDNLLMDAQGKQSGQQQVIDGIKNSSIGQALGDKLVVGTVGFDKSPAETSEERAAKSYVISKNTNGTKTNNYTVSSMKGGTILAAFDYINGAAKDVKLYVGSIFGKDAAKIAIDRWVAERGNEPTVENSVTPQQLFEFNKALRGGLTAKSPMNGSDYKITKVNDNLYSVYRDGKLVSQHASMDSATGSFVEKAVRVEQEEKPPTIEELKADLSVLENEYANQGRVKNARTADRIDYLKGEIAKLENEPTAKPVVESVKESGLDKFNITPEQKDFAKQAMDSSLKTNGADIFYLKDRAILDERMYAQAKASIRKYYEDNRAFNELYEDEYIDDDGIFNYLASEVIRLAKQQGEPNDNLRINANPDSETAKGVKPQDVPTTGTNKPTTTTSKRENGIGNDATGSTDESRVSGTRGNGDNQRGRDDLVLNDNFTIDSPIAEGGQKTKFKNNIKAIGAIRKLANGEALTLDDKKDLSKYVGWGGIPQAFAKPDGTIAKGWEREAEELKSTLTPEEYDSARRSTQDAHYTSKEIITGIWKAVEQFGFNGGQVLEPSVGVGNFFGFMPAQLKPYAKLVGIELDKITSAIASALYPKARISNSGFQDYRIRKGSFDLAIGNPPFGQQKLFDKENKDLNHLSIHNFFFAKSLDALKDGGVLAMVVSNSLMDSNNANAREIFGRKAKLIGAIRLPNNAFSKNANTTVTTDIIFLQKLMPNETSNPDTWHDIGEINGVPINQYFIDHPENLLGEWGAFDSMFRGDEPALVAKDGQDTNKLLAEAIARLPKDIMPTAQQPIAFDGDGNPLYQYVPNQNYEDALNSSGFTEDEFDKTRQDVANARKNTYIKIKDRLFFKDAYGYIEEVKARINSKGEEVPLTLTEKNRILQMVEVSDVAIKLRDLQLKTDIGNSEIASARAILNAVYDSAVKKIGFMNNAANIRLFENDVNAPFLQSLEKNYDAGVSVAVSKSTGEPARKESAVKADIFTKRTQQPYSSPTRADNSKDALTISMSEKGGVDIKYMQELTGLSVDEITKDLHGLIYEDADKGWVSKEEYLSGNVKEKLAKATKQENIDALLPVIPKDVQAIDITVKSGAAWLPKDVSDAFIAHITGGSNAVAVYSSYNSKWTINTGSVAGSQAVGWGTSRADLSYLLTQAFNNGQASIYDTHKNPDGSESRVLNTDETNAANEKLGEIKTEFDDWIWSDSVRRDRLAKIYNDTFNVYASRNYDGSHLKFVGKVSDSIFKLRPHQFNAVWRVLQGGSVLFDHTVGTGKTATAIAAVMELKRTGKANKPLVVVPNHLVDQWGSDFMQLYPNANILVPTKNDFSAKRRKLLMARIASGDYDAIVIGHSQLTKIENPAEFEQDFIRWQINEVQAAINEMSRTTEGKKSRTVKQAEKAKDAMESKLQALIDMERDDNLDFEQLGIDALVVDEAHEFKNLQYTTGLERVAGLGNPVGSKKAFDLFIKTQFLLDKTGGNNLVFLTGTPISNAIAEMFTMMRYMSGDALKKEGVNVFDAWVRQFAEIVTDWELSPSGKYKQNTRLAKFYNMPELMAMYRQFSDTITREDIAKMGIALPVPKVTGGKPNNVVVEISDDQESYVNKLIERSENLPKGKLKKGDDNMLAIMSDARKAALDMRLINPTYGDNPEGKTNDAVRRINEIYKDTHSVNGTQLVFLDMSIPSGAVAKEKAAYDELVVKAEQGDETAQDALDKLSPDDISALNQKFSMYDDMRSKLVALGIPLNEIAFIHDANTDIKKGKLFGRVRSGSVRILFGSTSKMGAGMNVQNKLVALHHIDAPWRPSDLEQREGRIIRQGNEFFNENPNFEVQILRYATSKTLDSRMWQTIEGKANFIEQLRKGDITSREVEDVAGEASNAAEMKAAASGNPYILEEIKLRADVKKLQSLEKSHKRQQFDIERDIAKNEKFLDESNDILSDLKADAEQASNAPEKFSITVNGKLFSDKKKAGAEIISIGQKMALGEEKTISYAGFNIIVEKKTGFSDPYLKLTVKTKADYYDLSFHTDYITPNAEEESGQQQSPLGLSQRIENKVDSIIDLVPRFEKSIKAAQSELPKLKEQIKPFKDADKLKEVADKHKEVNRLLQAKDENKEPDTEIKPSKSTPSTNTQPHLLTQSEFRELYPDVLHRVATNPDLDKRIIEKAGSNDPKKIFEYYQGLYPSELSDVNVEIVPTPRPTRSWFDVETGVNTKTGEVVTKKTIWLFSKFSEQQLKDWDVKGGGVDLSTPSILRHEIEHAIDYARGKKDGHKPTSNPDQGGKATFKDFDHANFSVDFLHRALVNDALKEGLSVPDNVLADYPELQDRTGVFESRGDKPTNAHTLTSFTQAFTSQLDKQFGQGWTKLLMATGKVKVVSSEEADRIISGGELFSFKPVIIDHNDDKSRILVDTGKGEKWFNTDEIGIERDWVGINADSDDLPELLAAIKKKKPSQQAIYSDDENEETALYEIDKDGNAIVYHATSKANANKILKSGKFQAGSFFEPNANSTLKHVTGRIKNPVILKVRIKKDLLGSAAAGAEIYVDDAVEFTPFDVNKPYFFESDIDAQYSKNGKVQAFYNPANDTTYFAADNIDKNKDLLGLAAHELGVHALQLGKDDKNFKAILSEVDRMIASNSSKAIRTALARAKEANTKAEHVTEEVLAYLVENHPRLTLVQKFLTWFRNKLRAIGKALPPVQRTEWFRKVTAMTESDLVGMAISALKQAPNDLLFDSVGRSGDSIKLAQQQGYKGNDIGESEEWLRAVAKGLDMSKEARMARAKAMGFDVDTPYYHGTTNAGFNEFSKSRFKNIFFFTESKALAEKFAYEDFNEIKESKYKEGDTRDVYEVFLNKGRQFTKEDAEKAVYGFYDEGNQFLWDQGYPWELVIAEVKAAHWETYEDYGTAYFLYYLKGHGFDSFTLKEPTSQYDRTQIETIGVFNSNQIRSINAAFDPDFADSPNLLASKFSVAPKRWSRAFFDWWNGSKFSDKNGQPVKFYHGSNSTFYEFSHAKIGTGTPNHSTSGLGFFFSPQRETATNYGSDVREFYLSAQKVKDMTVDQLPQFDSIEEAKAYADKLKAQGFDAIYLKDAKYAIVFESNQAKLTSNEEPTQSPDIRYSMASAATDSIKSTFSQKAKDNAIYLLQDKYIDLKRRMQDVVKNGGIITEDQDPRMAEELYHKRLSQRVDDFLKDELNPILKGLHDAGLSMDSFQKFLHAKHAPSRNAVMAERNPNQQMIDDAIALHTANGDDKELARWKRARPFKGTEEERLSLSGISDADAQAVIDALSPTDKAKMQALANKVYAINQKTLDLQVEYGLETQQTIDDLNAAWENYVPLHRDEAHPEQNSHPVGSGFSVQGSAFKNATGSNSEVTNILSHIAMAREQALTRGEKARVDTALINFLTAHPDPDFAVVGKVPTVDSLVNGFVETHIDPSYRNKDNYVMTRHNGKDIGIEFNPRNESAARLALALKNMDGADLDMVENIIAKGTRWFASVNTQYNLVFGIMNLMRDAQGGLINLASTPLAGKQASVMKAIAPALKAIYGAERGNATTGAMADLYREYSLAGGTTGFRDLFADVNQRHKAIQREFDKHGDSQARLALSATFKWLSDFNTAMENSVRLAAYKVARDNGLSIDKSASIAKNITVNFNRKGAATTKIGAFYAFFNASVQGNTRMFETLRSPAGKKLLASGVALGAAAALLGITAMGADDWDKIPEFIRERNLIIPDFANKGKYFAIPMPLGFNVIPNIGRKSVEMIFGSNKVSKTQRFGELLTSVIDNFNPLGGKDIGQTITPTVADPIVALWRNKDWTGKTIYKEDFSSLNPTAGFTRKKDTATGASKLAAEAINKLTGGTDYKQGAWSPTPDQLDYVFGQFGGGTYRELANAAQAAATPFNNEELPVRKVPLLGKLYGETSGNAVERGAYYDNLRRLNEHENEINGLKKEPSGRVKIAEYLSENPDAKMVNKAKGFEKIVNNLTKRRKELMAKNADSSVIRGIDDRIAQRMKVLNDSVFNSLR